MARNYINKCSLHRPGPFLYLPKIHRPAGGEGYLYNYIKDSNNKTDLLFNMSVDEERDCSRDTTLVPSCLLGPVILVDGKKLSYCIFKWFVKESPAYRNILPRLRGL